MHRISVTAVAAFCFLAAVSQGRADDYWQRIADGKPWQWNGEQASLLYSVTWYLGDFDTVVESPKRDVDKPWAWRVTVRMLDGGKEIHSFQAQPGEVFARDRDVLYFTHFERSGTGCFVSAYDFRAKKELWRAQLKSRTNKPYSYYRNAITIDASAPVLIIRGNETALRYIEYVDMKTGKTLAQREYPRD
jgi:hypothetical protein